MLVPLGVLLEASTFQLSVAPSACPPAFLKALASGPILPVNHRAPDRLLLCGRDGYGLLRSRCPFAAAGRVSLSAGIVGVRSWVNSAPTSEFLLRGLFRSTSLLDPANNLGRLVRLNDGSDVTSRLLPIRSCASRDSRSGSELPTFVPCTARWCLSGAKRVGHAVTGSPPGWESHPHGHRVVRSQRLLRPIPVHRTVVSQRVAQTKSHCSGFR